jgi:hypothetical protein
MTKLVLSVDPGKATGMALFSYTNGQEPEMVWSVEVQQDEYAAPIRASLDAAAAMGLEIDIVCERFTINAQTVKNSQAPFSLEQIGILKQCLLDVGRATTDIYFQSPSDAKAMFDNSKLKKLEYWHKGGEGHALDAIRHGLLHIIRMGWKPVRLLQ